MTASARLVPDASSHEGASHHGYQELQVKHSSCPVSFHYLIIICLLTHCTKYSYTLYFVQDTKRIKKKTPRPSHVLAIQHGKKRLDQIHLLPKL
jgi:hypothetical protein